MRKKNNQEFFFFREVKFLIIAPLDEKSIKKKCEKGETSSF